MRQLLIFTFIAITSVQTLFADLVTTERFEVDFPLEAMKAIEGENSIQVAGKEVEFYETMFYAHDADDDSLWVAVEAILLDGKMPSLYDLFMKVVMAGAHNSKVTLVALDHVKSNYGGEGAEVTVRIADETECRMKKIRAIRFQDAAYALVVRYQEGAPAPAGYKEFFDSLVIKN
jgi:hypothetical protein